MLTSLTQARFLLEVVSDGLEVEFDLERGRDDVETYTDVDDALDALVATGPGRLRLFAPAAAGGAMALTGPEDPLGLTVVASGGELRCEGPALAAHHRFAVRIGDLTPPRVLAGVDLDELAAKVAALEPLERYATLPLLAVDNCGPGALTNPLFVPWPDSDGDLLSRAILRDQFNPVGSGRPASFPVAALSSIQVAVYRHRLTAMLRYPQLLDVPVRVLEAGRRWLVDGTHRAVLAHLAGIETLETVVGDTGPYPKQTRRR